MNTLGFIQKNKKTSRIGRGCVLYVNKIIYISIWGYLIHGNLSFPILIKTRGIKSLRRFHSSSTIVGHKVLVIASPISPNLDKIGRLQWTTKGIKSFQVQFQEMLSFQIELFLKGHPFRMAVIQLLTKIVLKLSV